MSSSRWTPATPRLPTIDLPAVTPTPRSRTIDLPLTPAPSTASLPTVALTRAPRMRPIELLASGYPTPAMSPRDLELDPADELLFVRPPPSLGLHALLARPSSSSPATLIHSVDNHPTTALLPGAHTAKPIKGNTLGQPATCPPTNHLRIALPRAHHPHLPSFWSTIELTLPAGVPLTMAHVLDAIYNHLRMRVGERELAAIAAHRVDMRAVGAAHQARLRATPPAELQHYAGLRVVDFLGGRTRWVGLQPVKHGDVEAFELVLA